MSRTTPSLESAQAEVRRQFEQTFALVTAAHDHLRGLLEADPNAEVGIPVRLLEMAEDQLGDHRYLNVVSPRESEPPAESPKPTADIRPIRKCAPADVEPEHAQ